MNGSGERRQFLPVIPSEDVKKFDELILYFGVRRVIASDTIGVLEGQGEDAERTSEHEKGKKDEQVHGSSFRGAHTYS